MFSWAQGNTLWSWSSYFPPVSGSHQSSCLFAFTSSGYFTSMEKAMAPHSSTLAWKIPWTEEPSRLQSMGSLRVGHDLTYHFPALEKEMATHSSVLAWRIPGTGEPGGLPSMGSHRVGHNWSDLAAAAAWNHIIFDLLPSGFFYLVKYFSNSSMLSHIQCFTSFTAE